MSIDFHCRNCGKALRAPDDGVGRRCRCPTCGAETTVPQPNAFAAPGSAYTVTEETKECPYCAEPIKPNAVKCRFCGSMLQGSSSPGMGLTPPACPPSVYPGAPVHQARNSGFAIAALVLGLLGLCGIGSILAIIFGAVAIKQIDESNGELTGKGMAKAGLILGIVWLAIMIIWWAAVFGEGASY